jgi:hypothetical protein
MRIYRGGDKGDTSHKNTRNGPLVLGNLTV